MPKQTRYRSALTIPSAVKGVLVAIVIAGICFAGTIFYLKFSQGFNSGSLETGIAEINRGEYARAIKSLKLALKQNPKNADIYLALAQAYVGTDEVDQAWTYIEEARANGKSITSCPQLASQLANYYSKKNEFAKAIDILRPLVSETTPEKKAELADLDALWGDDCLDHNKLDQALTCWEEVRQLGTGTRLPEADQKLALIYQRLANNYANNKQDKEALTYLAKLGTVSQNYKSHEMASDIYERDGQTVLAIDELKKANELTDSSAIKNKLVSLLISYGKTLMNNGDSTNGLAYLQEAQKIDSSIEIPQLVLKNVNVNLKHNTVVINGVIFNNSQTPINDLTIRAELTQKSSHETVFKEEKILIDQFNEALKPDESRNFEFVCKNTTSANPSDLSINVYLNNNLYQSYGLNENHVDNALTNNSNTETTKGSEPTIKTVSNDNKESDNSTTKPTVIKNASDSPTKSGEEIKDSKQDSNEPESNEEKTLKDLDM